MRMASFIGPSYTALSRLADCQRTVNLYAETVESGAGQNSLTFYASPGRESFASLPDQPVRALFTQNGRTLCISGTTLYELFGGGSYVSHGTVAAGSRRPTMASNGLAGNQVFIVSGAKGYIFALDTNTLTEITADGFPDDASQAAFMDGYFLALVNGSLSFQISDLEDGLTWDGLDIGTRSQQADNLVAFLVDHDLLWLMGSETSEVWYNSGAVAFPFQPVPNVFIEQGCAAADSLCAFDNGVAWLGRDKTGSAMAFKAEGFNPIRISTHAIEQQWQRYPRVDDAEAFVYQENGHVFYQLTFPTAGKTWAFDASTKQWAERSLWDSATGTERADRAACHTVAFGHHLIGDRYSGTVYRQSVDLYADGDQPKRWLRRAPHLSDENRRLVHRRFELRAEVGVGLSEGQGSDPQVDLRWSDDGGFTYSNIHSRSLGSQGAYQTRVQWHNLGMARDRVYEVSGSDPVKIALIDAYLQIDGGAS